MYLCGYVLYVYNLYVHDPVPCDHIFYPLRHVSILFYYYNIMYAIQYNMYLYNIITMLYDGA